jgi:hypothetical protein
VFGSSLDRLIVLDNNRRGSDNLLASHVPIVFQQVRFCAALTCVPSQVPVPVGKVPYLDRQTDRHSDFSFLQMLNYLEECGGIHEEGILRICGETNRMRVIPRGPPGSFHVPVRLINAVSAIFTATTC